MRAEPAASTLLRRRLRAQGLTGAPLGSGVDGPAAVAHRLLAIQAQDPRGARLAIRVRTRGTTAAHVDAELTAGALVITWCNRGTLHLVGREDYPLLQALTTPQLQTTVATRLHQTGVDARDAARAVTLLDGWLAADGPLTRTELRERLTAAGVLTDGQAFVHLLIRAAVDGVLVRGPMVDGEHHYARVGDWLPEAPDAVAALRADPGRGHAELAHRYLAGHGPADARDLARWAGVGLRDARAGLAALGGSLREREDGLQELTRSASGADGPRRPAPRLLGAFEPLLMGWRSRAEVLGDHAAHVVSGGIFRAFALVDGRCAGVWRFTGAGITIQPLGPLSDATNAALDQEAAAVARFLGW